MNPTMRLGLWAALAAGVGLAWMLASEPSSTGRTSEATLPKEPPRSEWVASPSPAQRPRQAASVPAAAVAKPASLADERQRVYDAPKVLAEVRRVRATGTPDEKEWAAWVFQECYAYSAGGQLELPDGLPDAMKAVEAQRRAAFAALQQRCRGMEQLDWPTRRAVKQELLDAVGASKSPLHIFRVLQERHKLPDTRWSQQEAEVVAAGLYSDDPLVRREAFWTVYSAIDGKAPGGRERRNALELAAADEFFNKPLSEFERLQQCHTVGWCGQFDPTPAPEASRLERLYSQALARKDKPEALLAIR